MTQATRYCFLTVGSWEGASSFVRLREFGGHMLERRADAGPIEVVYVVDDHPFNLDRTNLKLHRDARVAYVPQSQSLRQITHRRRVLRELDPDVIHVLNPLPKAWLALVGTRWTTGRIVADWDMWQSRSKRPPVNKAMSLLADRWARKNGSLCVVASTYMRDEFRRQFGIEAVYVPFAPYLEPDRADGASPYDRPTAVYVGNLYDAVYDHDLLFSAAEILKARGKSPPIAIVGSGPDREKWCAFVRERGLKNVSLPGFLSGDELWRAMRHAAVLLFPIRPTLQNLCRCPSKHFAYAQARRPIIACRIGEVEQVLKDQAEYVEPTAEAFADAIERAVESPGADVSYDLRGHNWAQRTNELVTAVRGAGLMR
jgi:glycosyltransferase involved in cell wall biosynthesis